MKKTSKLSLAAVLLVLLGLAATTARAAVISFSGTNGNFTSPFTSGGFIVTPTVDSGIYSWQFAPSSGVSLLGTGYFGSSGDDEDPLSSSAYGSLQVQSASGGLFTFNNVSLSGGGNDYYAYYSVVGYLNGVEVASAGGSGSFLSGDEDSLNLNVNFGSTATIDTLQISLNMESSAYDSISIANIDVTAVPEPASIGLLGAGLIPLLAAGLRQRHLTKTR